MRLALQFDDVLITPRFSMINSRKDVDVSTWFCGTKLTVPIISSNMDTITDYRMAIATINMGAMAILHRFWSIERNVEEFEKTLAGIGSNHSPFVSIGLGKEEFKRAVALRQAGASVFVIDVAHGATQAVADQYDLLRAYLNSTYRHDVANMAYVIVGNFASAQAIYDFNRHVKSKTKPDAYKVGIGPGSMCTTRVVTGCGWPALATLLDMKGLGVPLLLDGGIKNSGDFAKALAAGATAVISGGLFAGTDEAPGQSYVEYSNGKEVSFKKYRGSASEESYEVQGKIANHRTPEGESTWVPVKGPVADVVQELDAGIRSAFSYVGAKNLTEFQELVEFVQVTQNGARESQAHGKKGN